MGKHSLNKETKARIRRGTFRELQRRSAELAQAFWYELRADVCADPSGAGEAHRNPERESNGDHGRVGRSGRLGKLLPPQVLASRGVAGKAAAIATLLIARAKDFVWEATYDRRTGERYWQEWVDSHEGATPEYAEVIHNYPRIHK